MKKILFIFCLFVTISVFSQGEKRLALVIGNANYEKGPLENPVNDARLIASTLDSLNFEVILHTNLETRRDLLGAISEFGKKRPLYDFGFIYYAGHGVQVDSENFLLPTKEIFESEIDVQDYGVSMQRVLKLLESGEEDELNILVLDACRDNPFEQTWNKTRSLKGNGLAKIPPPTGSLIAFSTDAGQTAPDGDGINSLYTQVLSKNLLKGGLSIEQVFKNVRGEVLEKSNGIQRPAEATQLVGKPYIINKNKLFEIEEELKVLILKPRYDLDENEVIKINKLIDNVFKLDQDNLVGIMSDIFMLGKYSGADEQKRNMELIKARFAQVNKIKFPNKYYKGYLNYLEIFYYNQNLNIKIFNDKKPYKINEIDSLFNMTKKLINLMNSSENIYKISDWNYLKKYLYIVKFISNSTFNYEVSGDKIKQKNALEFNINYIETILENNKKYFSSNLKEKEGLRTELVLKKVTFINDFTNPEEANVKWKELFKEYPNNTNLLITRAYSLLQLGEFELAEFLINKTISLTNYDPEPYILLYHVNLNRNDYISALNNINNAIERFDIISPVSNRGFIINKKILYFKAGSDVSVGLDDDAETIEFWELLFEKGNLYKLIGNKKLMCDEYNKIYDLLSKYKEWYKNEVSEKIDALILENCK